MIILAIESSCDETAAAVIQDGTKILSSVIATSTAMHEKWGGIVPEVAAREQFSSILPVITEALSVFSCHPALDAGSRINNKLDSGSKAGMTNVKKIIENNIDAIAVTIGPGLIGSLLIGVETAKTLAYVTGKPIIPVNHVLAHMYSNFVNIKQNCKSQISNLKSQKEDGKIEQINKKIITFPAISLVVSGGHTELFFMKNEKDLNWLGGTIDDAAGEAFDKAARLLGFGHGGGTAIEKSAKEFRVQPCLSAGRSSEFRVKLPRPLLNDKTLNFSFSGLKTAILREVNRLKENQQFNNKTIKQLSFEVQEAITDVLVAKTMKAVEIHGAKSILISGGVASNTRLREKMKKAISLPAGKAGHQSSAIKFFAPEAQYCTDNAAFVGSYAFFRGKKEDWHSITAIPDLSVEV